MAETRTILITGASSGIGLALAQAYAKSGATLLLMGRDVARLKAAADACTAAGARVEVSAVPVTDRAAMEAQVLGWDAAHPIDIVIANAGISGAGLHEIMDVNLLGALNTVAPLLPAMKARGRGQVVLVSSMAGFRGLPNAPAYSTSKVALRAWGDALRPLLKPDGITVTTVFPGFVRTPLTDVNTFPMPFLMEADEAARIMLRGIDAKKAAIAFPWQMHLLARLVAALPNGVGDWILSKAPRKGG